MKALNPALTLLADIGPQEILAAANTIEQTAETLRALNSLGQTIGASLFTLAHPDDAILGQMYWPNPHSSSKGSL